MSVIKGRAAVSNESGRFEACQRFDFDDGWQVQEQPMTYKPKTDWLIDRAKTLINYNDSPDIDFDRSINPYRGCEHGCIYCYARPSHTYLGHSAGLDFETILYAKADAVSLLEKELAKPSYTPKPIAIGVNTDAYQPLERKLRVTRSILEVLLEARHPIYVITKSSLIERDIDILQEFAQHGLVSASISLTTLNHDLAMRMEPRATAPTRRLQTIEALSSAGIPTRLSLSPLIPELNEPEIESLIKAAAEHGAEAAFYILLRLPSELKTLFPEWLEAHYPFKMSRVLNALKSMRKDQLNQSEFGERFKGEGPRAEIIRSRFHKACDKYGLRAEREMEDLDCSQFRPPVLGGQQMRLAI